MKINRSILIIHIFLFTWVFSEDCTCCITEEYFHENILSYHISMLDANIMESQAILYRYNINTEGCSGDLSINIKYKISIRY